MASRGIDGDALLGAELSLRGISALADLSTGEIVELVCRYAVWLPVETYLRSPWLAPYAVRRIRSRLDPLAPGPKRDLWGFPDERGYFSDDNSLIKGVVNNLRVNCDQSPYGDRPIGKGMVCCHVWAGTTGNPLLWRQPHWPWNAPGGER